jgi:hypothetical protein
MFNFDPVKYLFFAVIAFLVVMVIQSTIYTTQRDNAFKQKCDAVGGTIYRPYRSEPLCLRKDSIMLQLND